jgi:hypothetical protein
MSRTFLQTASERLPAALGGPVRTAGRRDPSGYSALLDFLQITMPIRRRVRPGGRPMNWLVIDNEAGVRIFEADPEFERLDLVGTVEAPSARRGASGRYVRTVAGLVNQANRQQRFERLVLVASPRFLVSLKAALSDGSAGRLVASVNGDPTRMPGRPRRVGARSWR